MGTTATDSRAVGPILWKHIKSFKAKLNIVENPSVGALAVPAEVCNLIDATLETMLKVSQNRESTRVRVVCTVDHMRHLWLEVYDDASWYDIPGKAQLSACSEQARPFGGTLKIIKKTGGEATARLIVPLPIN